MDSILSPHLDRLPGRMCHLRIHRRRHMVQLDPATATVADLYTAAAHAYTGARITRLAGGVPPRPLLDPTALLAAAGLQHQDRIVVTLEMK